MCSNGVPEADISLLNRMNFRRVLWAPMGGCMESGEIPSDTFGAMAPDISFRDDRLMNERYMTLRLQKMSDMKPVTAGDCKQMSKVIRWVPKTLIDAVF